MKKWFRSSTGFILSVILVCSVIFPYLPQKTAMADTGVIEAWGNGWHHYCIDGFGYASNGVCSNGDKYMQASTRSELNSEERSILFWSLLSFMSAYVHEETAAAAVAAINQKAEGAGLKKIEKAVTEEDLKAVLHSSSVRSRYSWLDFAAAHGEEYLRLAGFLGGSTQTFGKREIPAVLRDASCLSQAAQAVFEDGGFVLKFDPSGKDGDFIQKVPLMMSSDGENWQAGSIYGWNVQKTRTEIRFTNPNEEAGGVFLKFDPAGTEYASSSGGYGSADECYESSIQVWKCVECCKTHFAGGSVHPLAEHQRNVWMELRQVPASYYGTMGKKAPSGEAEGRLEFQIYRHEEDMEADYLVQLYKYDYETGKPLEGAAFDLYERFDDMEQVNQERDGREEIYQGGELYEGGLTHSPVLWNGFRLVTSLRTDDNGHASYTMEKSYHYDKTFCDGHPAPVFAEIPQEEIDEETGEVLNQDEIDGAKAINGELALRWLGCEADCQEKAEGDGEGVHFHWIMEDVDREIVETVSETGDCAAAGPSESADPKTAYESSGCREDCQRTYEKFIAMRYSYTFVETRAREGYILHGGHRDDVPVEIITTDSSQNGANAEFGGGYGAQVTGQFMLTRAVKEEHKGEIPEAERGEADAPVRAEGAERATGSKAERVRTILSARAEGTAPPSFVTAENTAPATPSKAGRLEPVYSPDREKEEGATASNGRRKEAATASNADAVRDAAPGVPKTSKGSFLFSLAKSRLAVRGQEGAGGGLPFAEGFMGSDLFAQAYETALSSPSQGEETEKGPADNYSHSSGRDGEEEAWRIYDHRTEGEIHINKRDMELHNREGKEDSSYGQAQGDGVLEGAVYGLFAAEDLLHPDGATGVVYQQNDLVAIASTDKEGDASFLAFTEAPGKTYDYKSGKVVNTRTGWSLKAPGNLYVRNGEADDYKEDGAYTRRYTDFQKENGSCWIGRPLLMGSYYVKELSRSEGYELSVNGRNDDTSNYGYSLDVTIPKGQGSAAVTRAPYVEPQSSGRDEDTMPNVVHITVKSQGTGDNGYDLVLPSFPKGTRLYRKDVARKDMEIWVPSGEKEKQYVFDHMGQPVYQRADRDNAYAKRNPDGSFVTEEAPVSAVVPSMGRASIQAVNEEAIIEALEEGDHEENRKRLNLNGTDGRQFLYIKMKTELALRNCGYDTPGISTRTEGVYNRGVREGEPDHQGISGVRPGEPASQTVYGYPVVRAELPKKNEDGSHVTVEEAIVALVNFYGESPWYSFGGIHGYEETRDSWEFLLYAGVTGNPDNYIVLTDSEEESIIYHRIPWIPYDQEKSPRWVYASYSNVPGDHAFGTFKDFCSWQIFGMYRCSAVLEHDAEVDGDGTIRPKTVSRNVYYEKGEILRDEKGSPLQAYEWKDVMVSVTQSQQVQTWTEIPLMEKKGNLTAHCSGNYKDAYGIAKSDENHAVDTFFKLVLPKTEVTLTKEDIERLPTGNGYKAGDKMGGGDYALKVLKARVLAYLDYEIQSLTGDSLYVQPVALVYPGQDYYFQDGEKEPGEGTRRRPVTVEERVIRQSVRIDKTVRNLDGSMEAVDNFRFKVYLKSNLQQLYRNEEGTILWVDRKGRETTPEEIKRAYPALVPRLYTKVPHKTEPLYKNSGEAVIANKVLYGITDGRINEYPNNGYTAVLETVEDSLMGEPVYNYEKFFDAILVAGMDKWRNHAPSYTSHRPLGNQANLSEEAKDNAKVSDQVRQFAVNWYLDQEVEKLKASREEADGEKGWAYSDELYDKALWQAIKKSENYLRPFFAYDLDQIYAIEWDSEEDGGKDKDRTTLSADRRDESRCFGVSQYLPYGTYVAVEQQPEYGRLEDLNNRRYDRDKPKEIMVPSVYGSQRDFYRYQGTDSPNEQAEKYMIRFHPENHVIKAHNYHGDFEIYKYGMDIGAITNGVSREAGAGDYFAVTQSVYKPYHNHYNQEDDRTTGSVPFYLTEGMDGRQGNSLIYRFSSVSEDREGKTMAGSAAAHEGVYFHGFVPWTMAADREEPAKGGADGFRGTALGEFTDIPFKARLRLEKLDSETHENLLHDGAMFRIYRGIRDESSPGGGEAKIYEEETLVAGSREFLVGLGASNITKVPRTLLTAGLLYTGMVPAGTPVCHEKDQVVLRDFQGKKTGEFKAFTTTRDGLLKDWEGEGFICGDQNTGYLETPEALEAGVYVLVEVAPPAGYVRTKPVAVEIYSDVTSYYKEGHSGTKVLAVVYEKLQRQKEDKARIYIENAPIQLRLEKRKKPYKTITYKIDGRIDGSLAQIGGNPSYEYAYSHGDYLGYGWRKGTLEYLWQRKDKGDQVEIVYDKGIFAGYGYITKTLEDNLDSGTYVPGALMTLYEGMELKPSGDREDYGYEGLVIRRNLWGAVTRMYVREGYGGTRTELREEKERGESFWNAVTVQRPDTDILYYDLGDLELFTTLMVEGRFITCGYDKNHSLVNLAELRGDRDSVFAFRGGVPYLELTGGDFTKISYKKSDHILDIPDGMKVYHLDRDGCRDAMTDPRTGMAYVKEEGTGDIYVWPVKLTKNEEGRVIAADKIATSRVATIGESFQTPWEGEEGYLTGTWTFQGHEESHEMATLISGRKGQNLEGEPILHKNTGGFEKTLCPVLDVHGLPVYYPAGTGIYQKEITLYDRDGDPVRRKFSDFLEDFRKASYLIEADGRIVRHRLGESYLIENTWVSGESTPNDPFHTSMTEGKEDLLKRVPAGTYIMEEIKAPPGYVKGFPLGIRVKETAEVQTGYMEDDWTKVIFRKIDGTADYEYEVLDMGLSCGTGQYEVIGKIREDKGRFGYDQVPGAGLVLLDQAGRQQEAWITTEEPFFLEGVPKGSYEVKEEQRPEGFVSSAPVKTEVESTGQVQVVDVYNDHTKVEVEKYTLDKGEAQALEGAVFGLYEAKTDGSALYDKEKLADTWESSGRDIYGEFIPAFEETYREYGTKGRKVSWDAGGKRYEAEYVSHRQADDGAYDTAFPPAAELMYSMAGGTMIRIVVYGRHDNRQGRDFVFEYQFNYKKLPHINDYAVSYDTLEGIHRLDYLPVGKSYVLVEESGPKGYGKAPDRVITVEDTAKVQRHRILNQESRLLIFKSTEDSGEERSLKGAKLALYRADPDGTFVKDKEHLAAWWVSGSDGVYTEYDRLNGRIPQGFQQGDLRAHELKGLPDGIYYLAEIESPDYYCLMEPVKIDYRQEEQIPLIRACDRPVKGELEIIKEDKEKKPLKGAVFELGAYRQSDLGTPVFTRNLSDHEGRILVTDLPVGEIQEDGRMEPYEYRLKELIPPEGYCADGEIHRFYFQPDKGTLSFAYGEKDHKELHIINEKTRISIKKTDFASPKEWVAGALMEVYEVRGRDESGEYICGENPVAAWLTQEKEVHEIKGLTAGQTYLLREKEAPPGYELMKPMIFTLSEDGRRICSITGQAGAVTVHSYENSDVIRSVELTGRYGVRVEMEAENEQGQRIASWTAGGDGHTLRPSDKIREGEICCLTETTVYSDGTREVTGRTTRRVHWSEQGTWKIPDRAVAKVNVRLSHEGGEEIKAWNPSEAVPRMEVDNPLSPESPKITISQRGLEAESEEEAAGGSFWSQPSVDGHGMVQIQITCTNTGHNSADMNLVVTPGPGSTVLDPGEGIMEDGQIRYVLGTTRPGEQKTVWYGCQLEEDAKEVSVSAVLSQGGREQKEEKKIPVLQKNRLTLFYEVTGTGKNSEPKEEQEFQVFLYTEDGEELKGSYDYEGSRRGRIKSGDTISLAPNEYVVISPGKIYRNIGYEVGCLSEEELQAKHSKGQAMADTGACAHFFKEVKDRTRTAVFEKGKRYEILETTYYSNKSTRESQRFGFTIGENISIEGIQAADRKQEVLVSKQMLTGQKELEGALMEIVKEDGTLMEQWISAKEPHGVQAVLTPGEVYILREKQAPKGYGLEREIRFRVTDGEYANLVVMEDKMTETVISKTQITGEEELPGALMQILDLEGRLVDQWISGTKPYRIRGKLEAGQTYILHEEAAPQGYAYSEDIEFTVPLSGEDCQVKMRDRPTWVEVSKQDITGTKELPGAFLRITDKKGNVITEWVSTDKPYRMTGVLTAGEAYILSEVTAPEGYSCSSDVEFQVSMDGAVDKVVMKDDITRVEIHKVDQQTGEALAGAEFELRTLDETVVDAWVSTKTPYRIEGRLTAGETYILREKTPPPGYGKLSQDISITVPREPRLVMVKAENKKRPSVPRVPEERKEKKMGKVHGAYWTKMSAHSRAVYQTFTNLGLPRVGDGGGQYRRLLAGILGFIAAAVLMRRKKKTNRIAESLCLFFFAGIVMTGTAYAQTVEVKPDGLLVVTGEVCAGNGAAPEELPDIYFYKDEEYRQKSSQLVSAATEKGEKEVEEIIVYEAVEQRDTLPEQVPIIVTDQRYGTEYIWEFPVLSVDFYNWRWIEGFEFPITVEDADAEVYELNGVPVPASEDQPFLGYEEELLTLIQADPEYYRIKEVQWLGEPWTGEDQKVYREGMARGEKYVADCQVVYGGTAVLEPVKGVAWQSVYELCPKETKEEQEPPKEPDLTEAQETVLIHETEAGQEEEQAEGLRWYETRTGQMVISIGLVFLLIPVVILAAVGRKKHYEKQEKSLKK